MTALRFHTGDGHQTSPAQVLSGRKVKAVHTGCRNSCGSGIVQWLELRIHDHRFESWLEWQENFIFLGQLSVMLLFQYPFHHSVTAVACKRSWSFCKKCRWHVTAKHTCTWHMWLCMKWHKRVPGYMVYTEHAEMATVSCGTSHVKTKKHCTTTSKCAIKSYRHSFRITCDKSAASLLESYIKVNSKVRLCLIW